MDDLDKITGKSLPCRLLQLEQSATGATIMSPLDIDWDVNANINAIFTDIPEMCCRIGVALREKRSMVPVILSIIKSGHAFCCLPNNQPSTITEYTSTVGLQYLLTDTPLSGLTVIAQKPPFILHRTSNDLNHSSSSLPILYSIRTSGSTGRPKTVHVPEACILSNVRRLRQLFRLTPDDIILSCSPPTFDPFVVDVLLAATTGARLLLLNEFPRDLHSHAGELFKRGGVTVMQLTPSLFQGLTRAKMEFLLSAESSMRILCLGGEPFPEHLLEELTVDRETTKKEVYNLYGITEVSSWSAVRRWTRGERMDLGEPIDDEVMEVRDESGKVAVEGELWIGSGRRKCFIEEDENGGRCSLPSGLLFRATGDLVERIGERVYYKGRVGDVVKRFGVKISLSAVEEMCKKSHLVERVKNVCCLFVEQKILFFYSGDCDLNEEIFELFKRQEIVVAPDDVVRVGEWPLSSHGKVCKRTLLEGYKGKERAIYTLRELFKGFDLSKSFLANGGSSFRALQIVNQCSDGDTYPDLIQMLLSDTVSLKEVLQTVRVTPAVGLGQFSKSGAEILWKQYLEKCVDASPTVFQHKVLGPCVAVGSHSHRLVVVEVISGQLIAQLTLPDRIESKIVVGGDCLFLGCYDGYFYCFNFISQSITWRFNSHGMVKAEALLVGEMIVFGNYAEGDNLFALDRQSGEQIWSQRVGTKGILARAMRLNTDDQIAVCTLDGTVEVVQTRTGKGIFRCKLKSPIFTNPVFIQSHLIVADVTGSVHCLTTALEVMWSFQMGGNVFSSVEVEDTLNGWNLFLGCYDNCLYKLRLTERNAALHCELLWKSELNAPIYAKPVLREQEVICCTTKGCIVCVNAADGVIKWGQEVGGEVFSSPAVYQDRLLVGSRDNFLYCWRLNK